MLPKHTLVSTQVQKKEKPQTKKRIKKTPNKQKLKKEKNPSKGTIRRIVLI